MRRRSGPWLGIVLLLGCSLAAIAVEAVPVDPASEKASDPKVRALLDRFDEVQASVKTLSCDFTDVQRNRLLKDPIVMRGRLYMTKPKSVLWQVQSPEEMRFVVRNDEYVGYFPKRKRAERADIHRWSEQIFRFVGLGQGSKELSKLYSIEVADPGPEMKGTRLLVLEPKKRRVRKSVESVRLWVDETSLLPVAVEYGGKDGSLRTIRFSNTKVNVALEDDLYRVDIPADFTVSQGFSGIALPGKER